MSEHPRGLKRGPDDRRPARRVRVLGSPPSTPPCLAIDIEGSGSGSPPSALHTRRASGEHRAIRRPGVASVPAPSSVTAGDSHININRHGVRRSTANVGAADAA
ncbi:hypothetical protein B296_00004207 [Ensete ventricosum]|uniref:Uncharacterized protein n=1 Tax=Ensete ventricosum TaxID=4639 RepID=A0A426Z6H7_ENSVE|nr:hypothetical protein B296_00004207 [Ensete ventricosum]